MILSLSHALICCATVSVAGANDAVLSPGLSFEAPGVVLIQADSRWGISDAAKRAQLETELLSILEGPVENASRGSLSDVDRIAIESDPELHEAYRSAPAATLALIGRIRDAGGLKQ